MKWPAFYIWFLPLLWGLFTGMSFFYSGDEHGCLVLGAIVGTWICFVHQLETIAGALSLIMITGAIILGSVGLLMDWLSVRKKLWFSLFVLCLFILFLLLVRQYGSLQNIRSKHRSVWALVFLACNLSIYASAVISVIINIIKSLWKLTCGADNSRWIRL